MHYEFFLNNETVNKLQNLYLFEFLNAIPKCTFPGDLKSVLNAQLNVKDLQNSYDYVLTSMLCLRFVIYSPFHYIYTRFYYFSSLDNDVLETSKRRVMLYNILSQIFIVKCFTKSLLIRILFYFTDTKRIKVITTSKD